MIEAMGDLISKLFLWCTDHTTLCDVHEFMITQAQLINSSLGKIWEIKDKSR
jgi:hypothetical protein